MAYDVDYDFEFDEDEFGTAMMPNGVKWRGNLCLLPNGRYLPPGNYRTALDGPFPGAVQYPMEFFQDTGFPVYYMIHLISCQ
mgnify:CR=1 FL=1